MQATAGGILIPSVSDSLQHRSFFCGAVMSTNRLGPIEWSYPPKNADL